MDRDERDAYYQMTAPASSAKGDAMKESTFTVVLRIRNDELARRSEDARLAARLEAVSGMLDEFTGADGRLDPEDIAVRVAAIYQGDAAKALRDLMGAEGGEPGDSADQASAWNRAELLLEAYRKGDA